MHFKLCYINLSYPVYFTASTDIRCVCASIQVSAVLMIHVVFFRVVKLC